MNSTQLADDDSDLFGYEYVSKPHDQNELKTRDAKDSATMFAKCELKHKASYHK